MRKLIAVAVAVTMCGLVWAGCQKSTTPETNAPAAAVKPVMPAPPPPPAGMPPPPPPAPAAPAEQGK